MIERPHANSNFLVDLGYGDSNSFSGGFCEVVFPKFPVDATSVATPHPDEPGDGPDHGGRSHFLILRRGATGALDLYDWWSEARRGKAPKIRTVKITLLADDHAKAVFTWYFHGARPVSLSYSALNAMDGGVLLESIELAFDSMEMR